jgi:ubiquinone/menaquinone biosynthesis C-methylase UbiE
MADWRSYSDVADVYERVHAPRFAEVARDLVTTAGVRPGVRVLDVGTGTGVVAEAVRTAGGGAAGIDRSLGMLLAGRAARPDVPLAAAEAFDLPFRDGTFDLVLGSFVLAHFAKVETALFDIRRVTRRGGGIGVTSWSDGRDAYQDAWIELVETVVPRAMLEPAYAGAAPGHERFQHPDAVQDVLRRAGYRHVRTERKRYQWTYARDEFVDGLGTWAVGRFVRNMLGEPGWASFMDRARVSFAERFPDPLNDFRDVIVAVGSLP